MNKIEFESAIVKARERIGYVVYEKTMEVVRGEGSVVSFSGRPIPTRNIQDIYRGRLAYANHRGRVLVGLKELVESLSATQSPEVFIGACTLGQVCAHAFFERNGNCIGVVLT